MNIKCKWIAGLLLFLSIMTIGLLLLPKQSVYAADDTAVRVYSVDYYEEEIVLLNNNNKKIYYALESEASRGNWEEISADSGLYTRIDISWLSQATENVIVVKGENNSTESRITLVKKPTKLNITIDFSNMKNLNKTDTIASMVNIMSDVGNGVKPITFADLEWRKGTNGQWKSTGLLTVDLLDKFLINGANLYFRIKAVNDVIIKDGTGADRYPDGTKGRRFSNEIKVKIPKQAVSISYDVDGTKFAVELKNGKEYRVSVNGGSFSDWVQVTDKATRSLPLADMLKATNNNPGDKITGILKGQEFPKLTIEIRDGASSRAPASRITSINIKAQNTLDQTKLISREIQDDPITNNDKIYVSYNGDKNLVIHIPSASAAIPYEYCVVGKGEVLDLKKASWTSITKGTAVKVAATKAVQGGTLYVRMKENTAKQDKNNKMASEFTLASTCVKHEITYPSMPVINKASFTYIKKHSDDISFNINLGSKPYETTVTSVKLASKDIDFTAVPLSANEIKITLKKESLDTMANCSNKNIYIYFDKGTVDKTSIRITIQNPTPAGELSVSPAKGSNPGTTSFTIVTLKGTNNTWSYVVGNTLIENVYTQNKIASVTSSVPKTFTDKTVNNISVNVGDYLTIFESDKDGYIFKYKCIKITPDMIKTD